MTVPGRPAISARKLDNNLRLSFQGLHALQEVGIAERTARLEEVAHLEQQLVDSGVFGGEPVQARSELQIALEIDRTLPSGLGKDEIRNGGQCPRRVNQCHGLGEKCRSERAKRFGFLGPPPEKLVQQTRFLGRHAHTLAIDGVEAAYRIAERQQLRGNSVSRSKCRRTLAGKPKRAISPSRSARLIASQMVGVRSCRV